jgi:hypothetical protein
MSMPIRRMRARRERPGRRAAEQRVVGDLSAAGARAQCRAAVARARFGLCYAAANRGHWNNPDGLR